MIELLRPEINSIIDGKQDDLEMEHYLITVEGPWKKEEDANKTSPVHKNQSNGKTFPQHSRSLSSSKKNSSTSSSWSLSSSSSSSRMQKLMKTKFRKPAKYVPPHPQQQQQQHHQQQQSTTYNRNNWITRRKPLQPGELIQQYYGNSGTHNHNPFDGPNHNAGARAGVDDVTPHNSHHPPTNDTSHPTIQMNTQHHDRQHSFSSFSQSKPIPNQYHPHHGTQSVNHSAPQMNNGQKRKAESQSSQSKAQFASNDFDPSGFYGDDAEEENDDDDNDNHEYQDENENDGEIQENYNTSYTSTNSNKENDQHHTCTLSATKRLVSPPFSDPTQHQHQHHHQQQQQQQHPEKRHSYPKTATTNKSGVSCNTTPKTNTSSFLDQFSAGYKKSKVTMNPKQDSIKSISERDNTNYQNDQWTHQNNNNDDDDDNHNDSSNSNHDCLSKSDLLQLFGGGNEEKGGEVLTPTLEQYNEPQHDDGNKVDDNSRSNPEISKGGQDRVQNDGNQSVKDVLQQNAHGEENLEEEQQSNNHVGNTFLQELRRNEAKLESQELLNTCPNDDAFSFSSHPSEQSQEGLSDPLDNIDHSNDEKDQEEINDEMSLNENRVSSDTTCREQSEMMTHCDTLGHVGQTSSSLTCTNTTSSNIAQSGVNTSQMSNGNISNNLLHNIRTGPLSFTFDVQSSSESSSDESDE